MDLNECFKKMSKASGIKVGDIVRVLRKDKSYELGWNAVWDIDMDNTVGNVYTVIDVYEEGGITLNCGFNFPFFVLEKVEEGILVGDYYEVLPIAIIKGKFETLKKIWEKANKLRGR